MRNLNKFVLHFVIFACSIGALVSGCSLPEDSRLEQVGAVIDKSGEGTRIDLRNSKDFTDGDLTLLSPYGETLADLTLQNVKITDDGMASLAPLSKLKRLILNDTPITGAGLAKLAELPLRKSLYSIGLKNLPINDADLKKLGEFPLLIRLDLTGTSITDASLELIPKRKWEMINLSSTKVTPSVAAEFRERFAGAQIIY